MQGFVLIDIFLGRGFDARSLHALRNVTPRLVFAVCFLFPAMLLKPSCTN
jgi:hypothetical protein